MRHQGNCLTRMIVTLGVSGLLCYGDTADAKQPSSTATTFRTGRPAADMALYQRGLKLLDKKRYAEAVTQFSTALRHDPTSALAYNGRGYAHLRLRHYGEAILDFDQAIRLNPSYANAYLNRGVARRSSGDRSGANEDLEKARELAGRERPGVDAGSRSPKQDRP